MVTTYLPKRPVFNKISIQRLIKTMLKENEEDRKNALDASQFFRRRIDDIEDGNDEDKKLYVECLKLAANVKTYGIRLMDTLVKVEEKLGSEPAAGGKETALTSFNELRNLVDKRTEEKDDK